MAGDFFFDGKEIVTMVAVALIPVKKPSLEEIEETTIL